MAALDFGMALSRGMLPKAQSAQKDLIDLAGGRDVFRSEDWWNKQVDKQISKGYRTSEKGTEYMTKSGQYVLGKRTLQPPQMYDFGGPRYAYNAPKNALITGYTKPVGSYMFNSQPIYETRQVDVYGQSGRKDYTAGQLKDIEKSAKSGAKRAKREAAQAETAKKRLTRGTGGLAAKAIPIGGSGGTGLPELGTGGLQLGATSLGKGLFV